MAFLHNLGQFQPWGSTIPQHSYSGWAKYFLFSGTEDCEAGDHEVFYHGNTVWWSAGQTIKKSYSTSFPIVHVCWARFDASQPSAQDLCVLHTDGLTIFTSDGKQYQVVLPCAMSRLWPMPTGVLAERARPRVADAHHSTNSTQSPRSEAPEPFLFSLLHPLEPVKPLGLASPTPEDNGDASGGVWASTEYLTAPGVSVAFSSPDVPFLVLYDSQRDRHAIYRIDQPYEDGEQTYEALIRQQKATLAHKFPTTDGTTAVDSSFESDLLWRGQGADLAWEEGREASDGIDGEIGADLQLRQLYFSEDLMQTTEDSEYFVGRPTNGFILGADDGALAVALFVPTMQFLLAYHIYFSSSEAPLSIGKVTAVRCADATPVGGVLPPVLTKLDDTQVRQFDTTFVTVNEGQVALQSLAGEIGGLRLPAFPQTHHQAPNASAGGLFTPRTPQSINSGQKPSQGRYVAVSPATPFSPIAAKAASSPMQMVLDAQDDEGSMEMQMDISFSPVASPIAATPTSQPRPVFSTPAKPFAPVAASTPMRTPQDGPVVVVGVEQSVGRRVSLRLSDGRIYRAQVRLPIAENFLTGQILQTLKLALPAEVYLATLGELVASSLAPTADPIAVFAAYFNQAIAQATSAKETSAEKPEGDSEAWDFLVRSDHHRREAQALRLHADAPPLPSKPLVIASTNKKSALADLVGPAVVALHALAEALAVSTLDAQPRATLSQLLASWTSRLKWANYVEYYARTGVAGVSLSSLPAGAPAIPPPSKTPASIYQWILDTLRGSKQPFPLILAVGASEAQAGVAAMDRTRKVCRAMQLLAFGSHLPLFAIVPRQNAVDKKVDHVEDLLAELSAEKRSKWHGRVKVALQALADEFSQAEFDALPFGIALPFREVIQWARHHPSHQLSTASFSFVGRQDLAFLTGGLQALGGKLSAFEIVAKGSSVEQNLAQLDPAAHNPSVPAAGQQSTKPAHVANPDGTLIEHWTSVMRFAADNRLQEVQRLLRSSRPIPVLVTEAGLSDRDLLVKQQKQLWVSAGRQWALPVGRGALTLGTDVDPDSEWSSALSVGESTVSPRLASFSVKSEQIPIPLLSSTGRAVGSNATVQFDATTQLSLVWPEFHNGVAAGLRIAPEEANKITSTWITHNKPKGELPPSHAGLLLALGLLGPLRVLSREDIFDYLKLSNVPISVALLLGLAACSYGSGQRQVEKTLTVHIPALHPPSAADVEVPAPIQSAALVGMGLLLAGSAQRRTAEVLRSLIPASAKPEMPGREAFSLSAGIGLGLICLAKGNTAPGLEDLQIAEHLLAFVHGGRSSLVTNAAKESAKNPGAEWAWFGTASLPATQQPPAQGSGANATNSAIAINRREPGAQTTHVKPEKPSLTIEGTQINSNLTAPGAILALALMFLKTNDHALAAKLAIPETVFLLEQIRPDLQMLRTMARAVILWEAIAPSDLWLAHQLPPVVRSVAAMIEANANMLLITDEENGPILKQAYINITAGACYAMALKFAGTHHAGAMGVLKRQLQIFVKLQKQEANKAVKPNIEQAISLAALAVAVVMAGSGDLEILRILRKLRKRQVAEVTYGDHMAIGQAIGILFLGGGRFTMGTSDKAVAALMVTLYPHFPLAISDNRYSLQAYRHLYVLAIEPRCLAARDVDTGRPLYVPVDVIYRPPVGSTPATSLPPSAAVLRTPAHPTWPASPNRRGVRLLSPSRLPLSPTPVKPVPGSRLSITGGGYRKRYSSFGGAQPLTSQGPGLSKVRLFTPCLLPPLDWIVQIDVAPTRYWPLSLKPNRNPDHLSMLSGPCGGTMLVKRRAGMLPYSQDASESQSVLTTFAGRIDTSLVPESTQDPQQTLKPIARIVQAVSDDPFIRSFAQQLCLGSQGPGEVRLASLLYECIVQEKAEVLMTYMHLRQVEDALAKASEGPSTLPWPVEGLVNLKLILAFYDHLRFVHRLDDPIEKDRLAVEDENWRPAIASDFLAHLVAQVRTALALTPERTSQLRAWVASPSTLPAKASEWVRNYVNFHELPTGDTLREVQGFLAKKPLRELPETIAALRQFGLSPSVQLCQLVQ